MWTLVVKSLISKLQRPDKECQNRGINTKVIWKSSWGESGRSYGLKHNQNILYK